MSNPEREPNPELEMTIKLKCHCCSRKLLTSNDNTAYFVYEYQPWFNHTRTVCDKGGVNVRMTDMENIDDLIFANQFETLVSESGYCDEEAFLEFYKELRNITDLEYKELTPRQEGVVNYLAYLLDNTPIELILDEWS